MQDMRCTRCGEHKPLTAFPRNATKRNGRDTECLRCKHTRENSPEARRAKRARELERKYGLTIEEYEQMVEVQKNLCAVCGQPETKTNRFGERIPLAVDHDHKTGTVRGLLCSRDNKAIGLLGDTVDHLTAALAYLQR